MAYRHNDLFGQVASFQALHAAALRAARGKRRAPAVTRFLMNLETNVLALERELLNGAYTPGVHRDLIVRDPKLRVVSVAPFRDRVVHQALVGVIGPIFEHGFIADTYANRTGYGTHRAIARFEQHRARHGSQFVLRADIFRYFPAIDHALLKQTLRRRLRCRQTLALADRIIDCAGDQERVDVCFPGDDLFTPHTRRKGLPLGNLTSQFFGNLDLDRFDHWVTEVLRLPYVRYVDDFAVFSDSHSALAEARERIAHYLEGRRLVMHPRKTVITSLAEPQRFLGFDLLPDGRRRLADENVARFRKRLHHLRQGFRAGTVAETEVRQRINAWTAHARHADTVQLRSTLFKGGWFDPLWHDQLPGGRSIAKRPNPEK